MLLAKNRIIGSLGEFSAVVVKKLNDFDLFWAVDSSQEMLLIVIVIIVVVVHFRHPCYTTLLVVMHFLLTKACSVFVIFPSCVKMPRTDIQDPWTDERPEHWRWIELQREKIFASFLLKSRPCLLYEDWWTATRQKDMTNCMLTIEEVVNSRS